MKQKFVEGVGLVPLELDEAAKAYSPDMDINHEYSWGKREGFVAGGIKGMEIQKEIDRQEIERLQDLLIRAYNVIPPFKYEDLCAEIEKELKL